jgi:hypothetical protein
VDNIGVTKVMAVPAQFTILLLASTPPGLRLHVPRRNHHRLPFVRKGSRVCGAMRRTSLGATSQWLPVCLRWSLVAVLRRIRAAEAAIESRQKLTGAKKLYLSNLYPLSSV